MHDRFLKSLDAADKLHQNMQQQQSCLLQFTMTVALRLADKFHGAILIVQSFPWSPDVLSIVDVLAAEGGEPSTGMGSRPHCQISMFALNPKPKLSHSQCSLFDIGIHKGIARHVTAYV